MYLSLQGLLGCLFLIQTAKNGPVGTYMKTFFWHFLDTFFLNGLWGLTWYIVRTRPFIEGVGVVDFPKNESFDLILQIPLFF